MTNKEKALALINTFATGDTKTAGEFLAENYIQHNLAYGTGREAFVGSVAYLATAPVKTTVNNIRAFEDGDKVFLQTVYNFAGSGEQVAFDIFRIDDNGLIAEHWDNLAAVSEPNPSGHTQIDGTKEKKKVDAEELFRKMDAERKDCLIPSEFVPKCPVCGGKMAMHLRCDNYFVEDEQWHEAADRYADFLEQNKGKKVVLIELGVGFNTPIIIRFPFEKLIRENASYSLIRLNMDEAVVPESFGERAIGIGGDMSRAITDIRGLIL